MTTIYFVRHGEYENPDKICPWRMSGFPLSDQGRIDIEQVGEYFKDKDIKTIYSSPILRTKQSAEILSKILNVEIEFSTLIQEIYTPMQNKRVTYLELFKKKTIPYEEEFHIKNNGENFDDIFKRVNQLVNKVLVKHVNKNIIFVSHGDPIMIYYYRVIGKSFNFEDLLDGEDYISKAGMIKFTFENNTLLNAEKAYNLFTSLPLR